VILLRRRRGQISRGLNLFGENATQHTHRQTTQPENIILLTVREQRLKKSIIEKTTTESDRCVNVTQDYFFFKDKEKPSAKTQSKIKLKTKTKNIQIELITNQKYHSLKKFTFRLCSRIDVHFFFTFE